MSVLHGLDQDELRTLITEVKDMLRDDDEPGIGRLGEQEIRGMLMYQDADTEEEVRAYILLNLNDLSPYLCII
jgi:hypothetical protein